MVDWVASSGRSCGENATLAPDDGDSGSVSSSGQPFLIFSNHEAQYAHWSSLSAVEFVTDVALRLEVSMVLLSVQ